MFGLRSKKKRKGMSVLSPHMEDGDGAGGVGAGGREEKGG
jgi:hypothetical protein